MGCRLTGQSVHRPGQNFSPDVERPQEDHPSRPLFMFTNGEPGTQAALVIR
jgi:hypothetical protein